MTDLFDDITIRTINLKRSTGRRERMDKRLRANGLHDHNTFIEAVDALTDPLVKERRGSHVFVQKPITDQEVACFLSHLKALRDFIQNTDKSWCVIFEDDVMLHHDFVPMLTRVMSALPANTPLCLLSAYVSDYEGVEDAGDLFNTIGPQVYGALAYVISRKYAQHCLGAYDKPFESITIDAKNHHATRFTSEHITRFSGGLWTQPFLAIQESVDSHIQTPEAVALHRKYFSQFGVQHYQDK